MLSPPMTSYKFPFSELLLYFNFHLLDLTLHRLFGPLISEHTFEKLVKTSNETLGI